MYYVNNCKKAKTSKEWSSIINKKLLMYISESSVLPKTIILLTYIQVLYSKQ